MAVAKRLPRCAIGLSGAAFVRVARTLSEKQGTTTVAISRCVQVAVGRRHFVARIARSKIVAVICPAILKAVWRQHDRVVITTAPGLACKLTQGRAASNPVCDRNIAVAAVFLALAALVCMIVRALAPEVIATAVFIDSIASRRMDLAACDARVRVIAVAAERTVGMFVARTKLRTAVALLAERSGRAAAVTAR